MITTDQNLDTPREWAEPRPGPDAGLTDHLWRLALPHLQGALHEPALVHTVRRMLRVGVVGGARRAASGRRSRD